MFDAYCDQHGCRVLLPAAHMIRMERHPDGRIAHFRCWCGAVAEWRSRRQSVDL
jgi:allantoicase